MTQRDFDGFLKIGTIIVIVSAIICTVFGFMVIRFIYLI